MSAPVAQPKQHHGIALHCPVCSHDHFHERAYALRSPAASFFNHFWSLDETIAYACAQCGYMLLFAKDVVASPAASSDISPRNAVTSRVL